MHQKALGNKCKQHRRASWSVRTGNRLVAGLNGGGESATNGRVEARRGSVPMSVGTALRSLSVVEQIAEEALEAVEAETTPPLSPKGIGGAKASSTFYVSFNDE